MKPLVQLNEITPTRVDVHLASDDLWGADKVEFVNTESGEGIRLKAGLKYWSVKKANWQFVSLEELERAVGDPLNDLDKGQPVIVIRSSEDELERLKKALNHLQLGMTIDADLPEKSAVGEKIPVAFDVIEDDTTRRAIAKIAFNYLARIRGGFFCSKRRV